jgi:peptidoglycan/LPS O-acetylase OafA/YrhL
MHNTMGYRIMTLNHRLGMPPVLNFAVTVCIAIAAASAVTFLVDQPAHRAMNRAYRNWKRERTQRAAPVSLPAESEAMP